MAATIQESHPDAEIQLVRGGKGDFIVTVDGKVVWNKKLNGSFPIYSDLAPQLGARPGG